MAGQPLLTLHTDTPEKFSYAQEALDGAFSVASPDAALSPRPLILDRIA